MVSRIILTCLFWSVSGAFVSRLKPNGDADMVRQGVRDSLMKAVNSAKDSPRMGPPRNQPAKNQASVNPFKPTGTVKPFKPTGRPGPKAKSRSSPKSPSTPKPRPNSQNQNAERGNAKVVHVNPFAAAAKIPKQADAADFLKATPSKSPSKTASFPSSASTAEKSPNNQQEAVGFLNERTSQLLKSMTREISKLQMWAKYFDKVSVASLKRNDETIAEEIQMLQSNMLQQEMINRELREDISNSMNWLLSVLEATGLTERVDPGNNSQRNAAAIDFNIA